MSVQRDWTEFILQQAEPQYSGGKEKSRIITGATFPPDLQRHGIQLLSHLPADVPEAVESGLCVFAWPGGVKAPLAGLVEEGGVVVAIVRFVQFHVDDAAR